MIKFEVEIRLFALFIVIIMPQAPFSFIHLFSFSTRHSRRGKKHCQRPNGLAVSCRTRNGDQIQATTLTKTCNNFYKCSWQNVFLTKRLRRSWQNVFLTKRLRQVRPDKTSKAVLTKRLPDKTSKAVLTKRLPDKTSILTKRLLTASLIINHKPEVLLG